MPVYVTGGTDKPLAHLICLRLSLDKGQVLGSEIQLNSISNIFYSKVVNTIKEFIYSLIVKHNAFIIN